MCHIVWTDQNTNQACFLYTFHATFIIENIIPNWDAQIESRLFPRSFLLAGPRQRRDFWADSVPFVDTGSLVVICGNYREPSFSQVKKPKLGQNWSKYVIFTLLQPGSSLVSADDNETTRVNEGRRVSSKSPSLARAGDEERARKRTRLDLRIPILDYIFNNESGVKCVQKTSL